MMIFQGKLKKNNLTLTHTSLFLLILTGCCNTASLISHAFLFLNIHLAPMGIKMDKK